MFPWDSITGLITDVINKIWPDKTESEKAKAALQQALLDGRLKEIELQFDNALQQISVNKTEASNTSIFVAGWRPFVGWVCGSAFAWSFVFQPLFTWVILATNSKIPTLPVLDLSQMMPVLLGMLGLGAYRTVEKVKGINSGA